MPPRTLASLAHALTVAPNAEAALLALAEALAELDRDAWVALIRFDQRRQMMREGLNARGDTIQPVAIETTFDHIPSKERNPIAAGGAFVDFGDASDEFARLLHLPELNDAGWLSVRGITMDHGLSAMLALFETKKFFGARTSERFAPAAALFELAYLRILEREAREEAVRTLEDVTQRVHGDYDRRLTELKKDIAGAAPVADQSRIVALELELSAAVETARKATKRADAVEDTIASAVEQLEKAHIELHRRSEALRQKTRTLYLIDRVLTLDASTDDPRQLADGLLSLAGEDMHAQRCSLMLRSPDGESLYIAAFKGLAPGIAEGARVRLGSGVAGRVAQSREPLLVRDVAEARQHPLLHDQFFTTGSFISFPLVYHDELVGVVNLANRAQHGVFVEEDVDRVRLLALLIALIAWNARLPERLIAALSVA